MLCVFNAGKEGRNSSKNMIQEQAFRSLALPCCFLSPRNWSLLGWVHRLLLVPIAVAAYMHASEGTKRPAVLYIKTKARFC